LGAEVICAMRWNWYGMLVFGMVWGMGGMGGSVPAS